MKKFSVVWVLVGCTACVFCARQSSKEKIITAAYSLSGEVSGYKDNTWFYLQNSSGTAVDSALAIDGRFKFTRRLSDDDYPQMAIFETRNFDQAVVLWLENKPMTMTVEKGKFQDAIVTGSTTHIEWTELNQDLRTIFKQKDSIAAVLNNRDTPAKQAKGLYDLDRRLSESIMNGQIDFVKAHPASFLSASLLAGNCIRMGRELTSELYNPLTNAVKDSHYGREVAEFLLRNKNLKVGDKFADIEQPDIDSVNQKLSNFVGKVILLEFWAGWCGPCRKENPVLKETYATFNPKGFEIYAVSLDFKKEQWTKATKDDQLPWTQVSELKGFKNTAAIMYGVDAIPDNFLIDQKGIIICRGLHGEKLTKKLKELLN